MLILLWKKTGLSVEKGGFSVHKPVEMWVHDCGKRERGMGEHTAFSLKGSKPEFTMNESRGDGYTIKKSKHRSENEA